MTSRKRDPYRVFISYARREDFKLAESVALLLRKFGARPLRDVDFAPGRRFEEQIRTFIAHAHVFLPLLTDASSQHGWVHEEIGHALALNVPVLPLAVGTCPKEMLSSLQAVRGDDVDGALRALGARLDQGVLDTLVQANSDLSLARFEIAEYAEDRARMLAEYADGIAAWGGYGTVRQKGAFSSFHLPYAVITAPEWDLREGEIKGSPYHRDKLRQERIALRKHAGEAGCRLIIDPTIPFSYNGPQARLARLRALRAFLDNHKNDVIGGGNDSNPFLEVAVSRHRDSQHNVTIVGDWFYAESVSGLPQGGYKQTIFTRHAPSMHARIARFDQEFDDCLAAMHCGVKSGCERSIEIIDEQIGEANRQLAARTKCPHCDRPMPTG